MAAGAALHAETRYVISVDGLRVRSGASLSSAVVTVIPYGARVETVADRGRWTNMAWNGRTGWAYRAFLDPRPVIPRSDISSVSPSRIEPVGAWTWANPFVLTGTDINPDGYMAEMATTILKPNGDFQSRGFERDVFGTWRLSGNKLIFSSEKAGKPYTETWEVSCYFIRTDWVAMEMMKREGSEWDVRFMVMSSGQ